MYLFLLLFLLLLVLLSVMQLTTSYSSPSIAKPDCQELCGRVQIPYPFGIDPNCSYNGSYEITCNTSFNPPKPFLHKFNVEVMDIHWGGKNPSLKEYRENDQILIVGTDVHDDCRSIVINDFDSSPYYFSSSYNVLVAEGCGGSVVLKQDQSGNILGGCASICVNDTVADKHDFYWVGSCQASLDDTDTKQSYDMHTTLYKLDYIHEADSSACNMRVGIIDSRSVNMFFKSNLVPTILNWDAPASLGQREILRDDGSYEYVTPRCSDNHEGNPYLPNGCHIVRQCRKCRHRCTSTYTYDSSGGYNSFYCRKNPLLERGSILGFSLGMVLIVLVLGCYWLYRVVKKRKEIQRRSDYFKRNGGLLLQQQICSSSTEDAAKKTRVFSVTELEKATGNFNKNRILGQGGQGTVYKGMLKDGKIVAIKKSKKVDENQLEQFINEVVILSEINHRNVVQLLGCCLETEVPLLVYEFIQNGTLYQHIHGPSEDFHITWKMRLQMAAESANAIAYLHSSSSAPIYHRDIKSSNILLDSKFRAKVSDFGTSRVIDIEQTHVTTCVMGTYGYLDPEYFQSNQFTEKSDVYSFGVVLVELLTGKKPICPTKDGGWISLAVEFLSHMENSRLSEILDARVLDEGKEKEFVAVAELARQCLNMNGKERPTMKEIALVLDKVRSSHVPCSTEQNSVVGEGVMMEMIDQHAGSSGTSSFFSDLEPR